MANPFRGCALALAALIVWVPRGAGAAATDTQLCQAKKLGAAGRYTSCRINAEATYVKNGDAAKRAEKLAKCAGTFADALASADAKWGAACPSNPPTAALDAFLTTCSDTATVVAGGQPLPPFCGDGVINACGEECDGTDLGGETCITGGFAGGGTLSCTPSCTFDTSACQAVRTVGCCQISVPALGLTACTDVSLVPNDDCAVAASLLAGFPISTSATLAPVGLVCDGASGLCAPQRTGAGTCCQLDSYGTCAEANDPSGGTCNNVETYAALFGYLVPTTPYIGYRCVPNSDSSAYQCVP
jgi:hypothetical protein